MAWLIDLLIVVLADLVLIGPAIILLIVNLPADDQPGSGGLFLGWLAAEFWAFIAGTGFTYLYFVELMWRRGQTFGKRVMHLEVVPLDPRASLTRGTAAMRWLIEFVVASFVGILSIVDGLWQLWDKPFQQTLHDKVAKTVVVKVSP